MLTIPKKIKIGGMTYKVTIANEEDLDSRTAAQINSVKGTIKVLDGNPIFMQVSFLHEVLHAINMEYEEERIEFLAQALNQIIVDNPQLFKAGGEGNDRRTTKK